MGPKVRVAARFAAKTRKRAAIGSLADIASIGSAVALVIFTMITAAHLRIRAETGASLPVLVLAIVAAGAVFVTFVFTTLIHEPASMLGEFILAVLVTQMDAFNRVLGRPSSTCASGHGRWCPPSHFSCCGNSASS